MSHPLSSLQLHREPLVEDLLGLVDPFEDDFLLDVHEDEAHVVVLIHLVFLLWHHLHILLPLLVGCIRLGVVEVLDSGNDLVVDALQIDLHHKHVLVVSENGTVRVAQNLVCRKFALLHTLYLIHGDDYGRLLRETFKSSVILVNEESI